MKKIYSIILILLSGCVPLFAQKEQVSGTIYDNEGMTMPGVVVMVQQSDKVATTDAQGNYSLTGLSTGDVLVFTMMGFKEVQEKVDGRSVINIIMEPENTQLSEVVVVAYGTQKKEDLTGAVGLVKVDELNTDIPMGIDAALQGKVAGMEIIGQNGDPGQSTSIRIRGTRSISAGNDPLLVVDGIIDLVPNLSNLNPDDIKSISVLKDASSTAMYGSRGANGVILVTTKGGEAARLSINFCNKIMVSDIPKRLDLMNATEFATFRNDLRYMQAYQKNGNSTVGLNFTPPYENPEIFGEGTDWMDALTRVGISNNHFLSLQSGDAKQHIYGSFLYEDKRGVVKDSGVRKFEFLFKYDRKIAKWLQIGTRFQVSYKHWAYNKATIGGTSSEAAINLSPIVKPTDTWNLFGDNGTQGGAVFDSPYLKILNVQNFTNQLQGNIQLWAKAQIYRDLSFKTTATGNIILNKYFMYSPSTMPVATMRKTGGSANNKDRERSSILWEKYSQLQAYFCKGPQPQRPSRLHDAGQS